MRASMLLILCPTVRIFGAPVPVPRVISSKAGRHREIITSDGPSIIDLGQSRDEARRIAANNCRRGQPLMTSRRTSCGTRMLADSFILDLSSAFHTVRPVC